MTRAEKNEMGKAEKVARLVPTNWLDPLLTGPDAVIGDPPYSCRDIERLLTAIKERLQAALDEAKKEIDLRRENQLDLLLELDIANGKVMKWEHSMIATIEPCAACFYTQSQWTEEARKVREGKCP